MNFEILYDRLQDRHILAKTISYLKIGNKKFPPPFRSSKSCSIIDLKGVPTGKKVKCELCKKVTLNAVKGSGTL